MTSFIAVKSQLLVASVFCSAVMISLVGCATAPQARSPEEAAYLSDLTKEPVEFDMPKDEADDAMGRAQVFIAKYSSMKIQTATPNVVETFNVPEGNILAPQFYGYRVTRANIGDKAHFVVQCFNGLEGALIKSAHAAPERNARIMARYIKTGNVEYPDLIAH